jgi:hypothetical protein
MKMTLGTLLTSIRNKIVTSVDDDDRGTLSEIKTTLTIIREASYEVKDDPFIFLVVQLEDVARDGAMGMALKQELPSDEDISRVCD